MATASAADSVKAREASRRARATGSLSDRLAASPGWVVAIGCVALSLLFLAVAIGYYFGRPTIPSRSSVDAGFLQDMIDHHDQAVQIALLVPATGASPIVQQFASEVVVDQRYEIGTMEAWLDDWHIGRGDTPRTVMGWMHTPAPFDQMPGLQPQSALDALKAAKGTAADRQFLTMMIAHHQGGIHMADYAAAHAKTAKVRDLAQRIASTQRSEIADYSNALAKLPAA